MGLGRYAGVTGPDGRSRPAQDTVRPWGSLDDKEKQLLARMASGKWRRVCPGLTASRSGPRLYPC